jgi:hypothetical protein
MNTADELAAMLAELHAEVAALMRMAGIFYHAGHDDALGIPAAARKPPRRDRGKLMPVL